MSDVVADGFEECYTGAVYDVLRSRGLPNQALPSAIRQVSGRGTVAGPAFTVEGAKVSDVSEHETLLEWTRLLASAPPHAVVVCQPNDSELAHMGELSSEVLESRGVKGYVVDGGCRDTSFIRDIGFPVWCKYQTAADIVGRWIPHTLNELIEIGNVRVKPGDYLVADVDGGIVVPAGIAEEISDEARMLSTTESEVRKAIRRGIDPEEAYREYGVF